jgi:hypothetical protein
VQVAESLYTKDSQLALYFLDQHFNPWLCQQ